jgi:peptidoglycan/xylan/chitin deacetylase (PgdA/CDA1 family)
VRAGYRRWAGVVVGLVTATACSTGTASTSAPSPTTSPTPVPAATSVEPAAPRVDPATVHADELGAVPVLMYHQLLAKPTGVYDQTPAQFRAELELLYRSGYRTVTAADLVAGRVDVPAGRSPMVLTFDDSTVSQYGERPDGTVDPATAVGILLAVAKAHGEDHPVASFYVNARPFAGKAAYLAKLTALGMEIGEHTATHANLRQLDDTGVQRELVQGLAVITGADAGAPVTTMALPFGAHPHNARLAHTGSWQGRRYDFQGVLLVGSNPAKSPYNKGFDPLAVPRIRSGIRTGDQAFTSTYWLPKLLKNRFVSDGDPAVISFPKAEAGKLGPRFGGQARPY